MAEISGIVRSAIEVIAEKEQFTKLNDVITSITNFTDSTETSILGLTNYPRYDVYKLVYDRSKKGLSSLISGVPASIAVQESLLNAVYDIVDAHVGDGALSLTEWIADFENCFPSFGVKSSTYAQTAQPWGMPMEKRPLVRVLRNLIRDKNAEYYVVQFWPSRGNLEESYIVSGTTSMVVIQVHTLMNQWLMMRDKDVGQIIGQPLDEHLRLYPKKFASARFWLTTSKQPPFRPTSQKLNGKKKPFRDAIITVPFVDVSKLSYEGLRSCCGGEQGLSIGYWACVSSIGTTNLAASTKMVVRGVDFELACKNAQNFLNLVSETCLVESFRPVKLVTSEAGDRSRNQYETFRNFKVYPAKVTLTFPSQQTNSRDETGRKVRTGISDPQFVTIKIWEPTPSTSWEHTLKDIAKAANRT